MIPVRREKGTPSASLITAPDRFRIGRPLLMLNDLVGHVELT